MMCYRKPHVPVLSTYLFTESLIFLFLLYIDYGLDGSGVEFKLEQETFISSKASKPPLRPTQPPIQHVPGFFPGCKATGS